MHKGPRGTEAVESGHVVTVGTLRTRRPGEGGVQGDFDHIVPAISPALNTQSGSHHAPDTKAYVAFSSNMSTPDCQTDGSTPTLKLGGHGGGNPPAVVYEPAIGFDAYNNDVTGDVTKTIDTGQDYHHVPNVLQSTVRRLTPVECERLQGFPDNFTAIPWRKKGAEDCPDGPRYKALGNSMAVPVMRWIGERIQMVEGMTK
jgi:site-specific DNA-cytosine methylase